MCNLAGPKALFCTLKNGQRLDGFYHELGQVQHVKIESALGISAWKYECLTNNISIGRYISIEGAGKGYCTMVHKQIGPFLT